VSSSVIHYEVHVLERGRWHVHARYVREERDRAMNDARNTEISTGHATKVVRDVFYPETGTNQEQTIYLSASARRIQPRSVAERQTQAVQGITSRRRARARARQRSMFRSRSPFVRIALAMGLSLAAASVMVTLLSWAFRNAPVATPVNSLTNMLLTAYISTFVVTFLTLLHGVRRKPRAEGRVSPRMQPARAATRRQQVMPYRQLVHEAMRRWRLIKAKHWQLKA
jgi:hypothetical protein